MNDPKTMKNPEVLFFQRLHNEDCLDAGKPFENIYPEDLTNDEAAKCIGAKYREKFHLEVMPLLNGAQI